MAEFGRGIKAGIVAAVVFLAMSVLLAVTGLAARYSFVVSAARLGILLDAVQPWFLLSQVIYRVVQGVIFGAVFAALHAFLPGRTAVVKAMALALVGTGVMGGPASVAAGCGAAGEPCRHGQWDVRWHALGRS